MEIDLPSARRSLWRLPPPARRGHPCPREEKSGEKNRGGDITSIRLRRSLFFVAPATPAGTPCGASPARPSRPSPAASAAVSSAFEGIKRSTDSPVLMAGLTVPSTSEQRSVFSGASPRTLPRFDESAVTAADAPILLPVRDYRSDTNLAKLAAAPLVPPATAPAAPPQSSGSDRKMSGWVKALIVVGATVGGVALFRVIDGSDEDLAPFTAR